MAGTLTGGRKAAAKNLKNDPDFYRKIGRKGGRNGNTGGFAADPLLARKAGAKGGRASMRGHTLIGKDEDGNYHYKRTVDGVLVVVKRI